ncbi:hypothetical protein [Microbulbifer epialgicus]|uniref:Lipoprotein n=1 Tax=Microbulbifer epialgicus TaxID=393907 RepID=A0ABV4P6V9_9GAMM
MIKLLKVTLLILLVLGISSCMKDVGKNFRVKVSKVTEKPIDEVLFIVGDVNTSFSNFNEYSERSIYVPVPEESGKFDVIVAFSDGKKINLSDREYRSGLGVYISVSENAINYTKAHW